MPVTWNPSEAGPNIVLSNGNETSTVSTTGWNSVLGTEGRQSGKYYFEVVLTTNAVNGSFVGMSDASLSVSNYVGGSGNGVGMQFAPSAATNPAASGEVSLAAGVGYSGAANPNGTIVQVAMDMTAGSFWFGVNGTWLAGGNPSTGASPFATFIPGADFFPAVSQHTGDSSATLCAGTFAYSPPTGFDAWDGSGVQYFLPPVPPSGTVISRSRVQSATVYVDANAGNDSNDGTTAATAVKTIQRAFDMACGNFDIAPPYGWSPLLGTMPYRNGVTIQMAEAPASSPYQLPTPAFLGFCPHPVYLVGNQSSPSAYNLYASNGLQGLTSQDGAKLICLGFTIQGDVNCTLLNALEGGKIAAGNVRVGQGNNGPCCAFGAAGGSHFNQVGPLSLFGSTWDTVFEAVEGSQLSIGASPITLEEAMNFGVMVVLSASECTAGADTPEWVVPSGSSGQSYVVARSSFLGFPHALIPGTTGYCDSTSTII